MSMGWGMMPNGDDSGFVFTAHQIENNNDSSDIEDADGETGYVDGETGYADGVNGDVRN